jgi:CheY-like chemotaxis protein
MRGIFRPGAAALVGCEEAGMEQDEVRVVLVHDMPAAFASVTQALRLEGYAVRTASSGGEALEIIEQFTPLCVLLDIHIPGLGGHELSDRLRKRHGDDIVLIAITDPGQEGKRAEQRLLATFTRFDHCLCKPIDLQLLKPMLPPLRRAPAALHG